MLDGLAGVLSFGPRRRLGLTLCLEDDVGAADLSGGGDVLPALKVKSVFVRENDGRLSGDVRRDTSRDSGRTGIRLLPMEVRFVRYLGAMLAA